MAPPLHYSPIMTTTNETQTLDSGKVVTDMDAKRIAGMLKFSAKILRGRPANWEISAFRGNVGEIQMNHTFGTDLDAALAYAAEILSGDVVTVAQLSLTVDLDPDADCCTEIRRA